MQTEVTLKLTPQQLQYLKIAVKSDIDDLADLGSEGACQDIIDEDLALGRSVMKAIERTEQEQVFAN